MGRLTTNEHRRRNREINRIASVCAAAGALLFSSCQDLGVFMDEIDDQVKLANNGYLEVEAVYPSQNSWFVNPGQDIQVTFDRSVSPEAALACVVIQDSQGNTFPLTENDVEFNEVTRTLTLKPDPYLADSRQYSISLSTKLMARDASVLRTEYAWSFTTGTYPKGTFVIHDDVPATGIVDKFTTSTVVPIEVTTSNAEDFHISNTLPAATTNAEKSSLSWQALTLPPLVNLNTVDASLDGITGVAWELGASPQGPRTVYMLFRDNTAPERNYTPVETGKVFLDSIPPTVDAGTAAGPVNFGYSRTAAISDPGASSGTGSGIASIEWDAPGTVAISRPTSEQSIFTGPADTDATYTVNLEVTDKAGNVSTDSFSLDWDTEAPAEPVFTSSIPTPTSDDTPTWTWGQSSSGDRINHWRRRLDGGSWVSDYDQSYTPSARFGIGLADGRHTLDVAQYDDAGNLSDYDTQVVYVNRAGVSPYPDQILVSTSTSLNWPNYVGIGTFTYRYYVYRAGKSPLLVASDSTGSTSQSGSLSLSSGTAHYWYYDVFSGKSRIYTSPNFAFTTTGIVLP